MLSSLVCKELSTLIDLKKASGNVDIFTFPGLKSRDYLLGLAFSPRLIEEALRLRYRIFNLEMGGGLRSSEASGVDSDRFDRQMDHLVLLNAHSGEMVGTYRLQTITRALEGEGIYSAQEFDLTALEPVLAYSIELGRACLALPYTHI